jgi:cellobiose-specific phosphotransferase system component IIC
MEKTTVAVLGFGAGVISVYVVARLYRNTIRASIANSVTGKVSSSLSTIIPGIPITIDGNIQALIQENISYPVADGVLNGLML